MDLLGVFWYAHKMFGNSLAHIPFVLANLFFNSLTIALLVALAWPLLCEYTRVEYLFLIPRSL